MDDIRTYRTDLPCKPLRDGQDTKDGYVASPKDAAKVFAERWARRIYGKRGYCHHVRLDHYNETGRYQSFEAFIGVPAWGGGTSGRNITLTVTVEE